jgi:RNA polymerase sigma-70 factor (ECF subfamily)
VVPFPSGRVEAWARFDTFFQEQHERLFKALYFVTGNRHDAEELMQDAFLRLWERWDEIGRIEDPIGYLFRIALNGFRMRRCRAAMSIRKVIPLPEPRDLFLDAEMRADVRQLLLEVTPRQRAALVLVDLLGYPSEQAARILRVRPSTVRALATQGIAPSGRRKEHRMPEVQEVFHMATQKVGPDPGALERQHHQQQQRSATQKAAVFVLIGALVIGGVVFGIGALRSDQARRDNVGTNPTASPLATVTDGPLEPGRYVISTTDPDFNASHRITLDVPEGYSGVDDVFVFDDALVGGNTGLAIWPVADVFVDACEWRGARSAVSSADDVVAALATRRRSARRRRPTPWLPVSPPRTWS